MPGFEAADAITPEQLFEDIVPRLMKASERGRRGGEGVCEIRLSGASAGRAWTVDLGAGTVSREPAAAPDLSLEMERSDFQAMMLNRLDVVGAVRKGRIRCRGKLPLLAQLAGLLVPGARAY